YGAVGEWIWARIAGIDWSENGPGYRHVRLRPTFDARLGYCRARYRAHTGVFESHWQMTGNDTISWRIVIPPNCTGTIELPPGWAVHTGPTGELASGIHDLSLMRA